MASADGDPPAKRSKLTPSSPVVHPSSLLLHEINDHINHIKSWLEDWQQSSDNNGTSITLRDKLRAVCEYLEQKETKITHQEVC